MTELRLGFATRSTPELMNGHSQRDCDAYCVLQAGRGTALDFGKCAFGNSGGCCQIFQSQSASVAKRRVFILSGRRAI